MLDLTHEPDWGFIYYPPETENHPGHPRLDIIIPAQPTFQHYDPQSAIFATASDIGSIEALHVHHPWSLGTIYTICAGRIIITDRSGKKVEAFSFGGRLQIENVDDRTICALTSTAPIFSLFAPHDLSAWLIAEVEVLLARQKARWGAQHPHVYAERLARIAPFTLYTSCLMALASSENADLRWQDETSAAGYRFVKREIKRLQRQGSWPPQPVSPDQLFSLPAE